jgi:thioredoxin 1
MSASEDLTSEELKEVLGTESRHVLVDFWSPWCQTCRTIKPHLRRLTEQREDRWKFVTVNVQAEESVVGEHDVRSLPTLLFFRRGKETGRISGAITLSSVEQELDRVAEI